MKPWIKHWHDWAMRELFWPLHRASGPQVQGIYFSYEKAGILVRNEAIPWNADAIQVEALVRFPTSVVRRKTDFALRVPGHEPLTAVTLHRHETGELFRLVFRLPSLRQSTTVELFWKTHALSQAALPVLTSVEFFENLQLHLPTLAVRLGPCGTGVTPVVPCQAFVGKQCRGLLASGVLLSPTCLLPLLDVDLAVEFIDHRTRLTQVVPMRLTSTQLMGNQALVTVVPPRSPRRLGTWSASWLVGGRVIARREVRAISQKAFRRSLYLADGRYVTVDKKGQTNLTRHPPALGDLSRLGPGFLIASQERGVAALCPMEVRVQCQGSVCPPALLEQEVLITDGPSLYAGTLAVEDLHDVSAFELLAAGQPLGLLSMRPTPTATFTGEGGFEAPEEYRWSSVAEEELTDRLGKLMDLPARSGER